MRKSLLLILLIGVLAAILAISCGSEAPETQALYTDAKAMFDGINGAFELPNGQARVDTMRRIIGDKWDQQIPAKLQEYLQKAPDGKYAEDAKKMLEEVRNSRYIQMIGQVRPLMEQQGMPESPAEADSMVKSMKSENPDSQ